MALTIWDWNQWIETAKGGDGELLSRGILKAVRTHPQLRRKTSATLMVQYGFDSVDELAQEVAIKVLKDKELMHSRDLQLDDLTIGRRINKTITNLLISINGKWADDRALYENVGLNSQAAAAGQEENFETFLERRLTDLGQSPEGQLIIKEILDRFYQRLTLRRRIIFDNHQEYLGQMKTEEMARKLRVGTTTIYDEILRIREELSWALGGKLQT
jgi:hypothetical protein